MAKGKGEIKGWITKNGVHIPIYGHYSVRGGEEPQAKGARFNGTNRKKKIKELGDRLRQKRSIGYKDLEEYMNQPGSTLEANYRNWRGDESYYVTNKDDNGEGITVTKAAAQKYLEKNKDNLNSERAGSEYEKSFSKKAPNSADPESDASKGKKVEAGQGDFAKHENYTKNAEQKKKWQDISKAVGDYDANEDKYKDRDWNKDVEDSKRYGYSEQTEEGKKPVTKAEEKKLNSFQEQVNDRFKTKKEWDEIAKNAGYKDSSDPEFQKNADDIVAKNKQASSKATPESYAQSKGKSIRDIAQEVNNNDAARATANQLMKDGRTYEEAAALAHSDMERGTLKGQESSTPTSDRKSYESLGRYAERKVDEAKTRNEMAQDRASAANFKQSYSVGDRHSNVGYETAQKMFDAPVGTKITMSNHNLGDYVGEYTKTEKGWVGSQDYKSSRKNLPTVNSAEAFATYVQGNDVKVVSTDASAPKAKPIGGGRTTPKEATATKRTGFAVRKEATAAPKSYADMSVSGLKEAMAGARPGDKTKIRAELRKRGYTYVGGKWIKA